MNRLLFFSFFFSSLFISCSSSSDRTALLGKWTRNDGGYQLEILSADASGKVEAKYFNPNQIHVSEATSKIEKGILKLHVTLDDTGYPGCTYDLEYSKEEKSLKGTYFQAAQNQSYEISFEKGEP